MAQSIRDVMTQNPECVSSDTTVADAAKLMKDKDFGAVADFFQHDRLRFSDGVPKNEARKPIIERRDPVKLIQLHQLTAR